MSTKFLRLFLVGVFALFLTACNNYGGVVYNDVEYENGDLAQFTISFDVANYLLERLDTILDADGGSHWGISLRGPVVIADVVTRYAVANMPDEDGTIFTRRGDIYVGRLPEGTHIGNTASYFGGRLWGMITLGLIEANSDNLEWVTDILLHELFHAKQQYIFEGERSHTGINPPHIRELDSRISIRLEINALLAALHATTEDERLENVHDALSIRAERRRLTDMNAALYEISFELLEGTAVYTEAVLGRNSLNDRIALVERYIAIDSDNVVEQFGYYSGALYALLLDEFAIDWRSGLNWGDDLALLMKNGLGISEVKPIDAVDLERYGYSVIRLFEEEWVAESKRLTQEAQSALSGSLLLIDAMGEFGQGHDEDVRILFLESLNVHAYDEFDYGDDEVFLLGLSDERTVFYGNFSYTAEFGELEFTDGFLMLWRAMWRHGIPAYSMEVDGNRIVGSNWVLTLNEGFGLREISGGHFAIERQ